VGNIIKNNDIIKNLITNEIQRVLWIDTEQNNCYCIQMSISKLKISVKSLDDINRELEVKICHIASNDDFYEISREDNLIQNRKEKLDNRYNIVSEIDNYENIPLCFMRKHRGIFVKNTMGKYKVSEKCVYEYLRKYWQGGRTKDALLDRYNNCGKCVDRKYKKKPGRKSLAVKDMEGNIGIVIDDEVKKTFQVGIDRYYRYSDKISLAKTFRNIIRDNYSGMKWYEKPTMGQFYNWYRNSIDKDKMEYERKGKKNYLNNVRPLKSDSIYESFNPGLRYQVDSTIFPIYLVNRIDRSLSVGKPIVYLAVDCFSTRITGVHVGLHEDSWEGYATLLYNTFQDKDRYCKAYGVDITRDEWNISGSPQVIMGDRGGFIAKNSDMLVKYLKISLEYAPSYLGSAKGTVEKKFDIIEKMIKFDLPGIIMAKYRERGQRDYRKDAKIDIYEFTQIVIEAVLERNATVMENYPLEKELVWEGITPSANEIWNWGIKNKKGILRRQPEDKLRFYLLRHENASVTEKGIKYKNMLYTCDLAEEELWFSRLNKNKKIEIAFDSRCMNSIMMYYKAKNKYIECKINRQMTINDVYIDRTLEEIENYGKWVAVKKETIYRDSNDELYAEKSKRRREIVNDATKKSGESKIRIEEINENRRIEKELYDEQQALTRNPYLENNIIDENKQKNEEGKIDSNKDILNSPKSSRNVLADLIRNKVVSNS
jgi:hypothetical protein